jgi:hypothetical protein
VSNDTSMWLIEMSWSEALVMAVMLYQRAPEGRPNKKPSRAVLIPMALSSNILRVTAFE